MTLIPPHYIDCVVVIGILKEGEQNWIGTGFLFGNLIKKTEDGANKYSVYLVTNKHVLNNHNLILIRLNPNSDQSAKDFPALLKGQDGADLWLGHPDPDIDVAVLPVNYQVLLDAGMKCNFFQSDKNIFTVVDLIAEGATEGDFVYVLGYPMGIVSKDRQHVFVRGGVVSRIRDLFERRSKDFVIDAPVFPGNSGGPVLSKPEVVSIESTKACNKSRLIGMVKEYIPYRDTAYSLQTRQPRIIFEENSGLSKIEPVDHILQTIHELEKISATPLEKSSDDPKPLPTFQYP